MIDRRIGLLFLGFVGLLTIALVRATYLGAVRTDKLQHAATTQQVTKLILPTPRNAITNRNNIELTISQTTYDMAADPYLITNPLSTAHKLAPLLNKPETTLLTLLSKKHTNFIYLTHLIPGDNAAAIKKLPIN